MLLFEFTEENLNKFLNPKWILVYTTIDHFDETKLKKLREKFRNIDIFGCTSFKGVFTPEGFQDGCFLLVGEENDEIFVSTSMHECNRKNAKEIGIKAAREIRNSLGQLPDTALFHPTPGFEELILQGINEGFEYRTPIYGGSAADNDISGKWFIFNQDKIIHEGFILIGFSTKDKHYGAFLSGYLPTSNKGKVTKVEERTVFEIDNKPAVEVYNEWADDIILDKITTGGNVLSSTTLKPMGKIINTDYNIPQYIISHPHYILPNKKGISFFTDFSVGDEISLMFGSKSALLKRVEQTLLKAIGNSKKDKLTSGILVYCAGCVGTIEDQVSEVSKSFVKTAGNIPFIGAATFGEQGCLIGTKEYNLHGNLMCCSILFGK